MFQTSHMILLTLLSSLVEDIGGRYPAQKIDYCMGVFACGNTPNNACQCQPNENCEVITTGLDEFREAMLNLHNDYRNYFANGSEKSQPYFATASDMIAVQYDVGLELTAACYLLKCPLSSRNYCGKTPMFPMAAHNIYYSEDMLYTLREVLQAVRKDWYENEISKMKENSIDKYPGSKYGENSLTTFLWWSVTHIGCARSFFKKQHSARNLRYIIGCNYASKFGMHPNTPGTPIYRRGQPCSKCLDGYTCVKNSKYSALCSDLHVNGSGRVIYCNVTIWFVLVLVVLGRLSLSDLVTNYSNIKLTTF